MSRRHDAALDFDAITIEGALLPAEWLARVAALKAPQQSPADYGVPKGLNLRDELGRYWRIAQAHWQDFAAARAGNADPARAAHQFLHNLLRDVFGMADFESAAAPKVIDEREYPVSALAGGGRIPIVIAPHDFTLDARDRRFGDAGRQRSAFGLLQDYLNAEDAALWGLTGNGLTLRLARDNASLTRPAWVEADLERIFGEDRFADFSLLWLLIHASRFGRPGDLPQTCALEAWREASREEGIPARERLRVGVEAALRALGTGFVADPGNPALRAHLAGGDLSRQAYFGQLLRLVYRLIFLLTIEERGLLHPSDADPEAVKLYVEGYGLRRLRERARRRRAFDRNVDLWRGLKPVFAGLAAGQPLLALPALGGLFAPGQCADLDAADISNAALLEAMFNLAWIRNDGHLERINWRDMGPEELGSVYESLLELEPELSLEARSFRFAESDATARGNARKTSGSYYTPDSLVQELLDSALEPVIAQRTAGAEDPEAALLAITVCDPACGSGHFLLGAARRLATHLAQLRAQGTPTGEESSRAVRDVIGHCVYGVDRNPMAVELCKVALWLEAIDPGRPLNFLDAHLRCGDALLGVHDVSVLRGGIPSEAYGPLKDVLADSDYDGELVDDKEAAKAIRLRNAGECRTPTLPLAGLNLSIPQDLDVTLAALSTADDSLAEVQAKERLYEQLRADGTLIWRLLRACDLWTAAFFSVKRRVDRTGQERTPTSDTVWRFLSEPGSLPDQIAEEVDALRMQYRFFHWPVEFAEVFHNGGFALVLGNPPWETMSPDAKEYFAKHEPGIGGMSPTEQTACISELLGAPSIRLGWEQHARELYAAVRFIKESGRYRLFARGNLAKGDFNVYRQFVELALNFVARNGVASQIVPENFYNGANAAAIRKDVFDHFRIVALYGFENTREVWFRGIDTRMKFALYAAFRANPVDEIPVAFSLSSLAALQELPQRVLSLPLELVREFSPDARAVMEFSNQFEIDVARRMYASFPKLAEVIDGVPSWQPITELHMGNDNAVFGTDPIGWPLYQGSMVTHHDYRAKAYVSGHGRNVLWRELPFGSPDKGIHPQWRVREDDIPTKIAGRVRRYRIGFCDVGNSTNQRALMAALIPPGTVCGHKVPTIEFAPDAPEVTMLWLAVANSLAMDFLVRMKIALTMSMSLLATLPFPRKVVQGHASARAAALAARLSCVGAEMAAFREQLVGLSAMAGQDLSPSEDPDERARLMAELDVVVARNLFGLDRNQMAYLLEPRDVLGPDCTAETFAALRRAEERAFGEYRTRRLVLAAWDAQDTQIARAQSAIPALPRRIVPHPRYTPARVPSCEAEDWLAGLACDMLLQSGPISEVTLRLILTSPLSASHAYAHDFSVWTAVERMSRLPAVVAWFRDLSVIPRSGDLRIVEGADLGAILGDARTRALASSLIDAYRAHEAELDRVTSALEPSTGDSGTGARRDAADGDRK